MLEAIAASRAPLRQGRPARRRRGVSRADVAALRDQSAAALHPRLLEPLRRRRRAARPVDHRPGPVRSEGRRARPPSPRVFVCRPPSPAAPAEAGLQTRLGHDRGRLRATDSLGAGDAGVSSPAVGRRDRRSAELLLAGAGPAARFEDGIQFGLRRILASPSFVFRPEGRAARRSRPARRIASPTSSWRRGSRSSSGAACRTSR